ncbi:hypothetical protein [Nocardioides humi]|uniref:Ig-like domain-containing protein n=1 Tax=Nocardioides humi TaxID=449461 RepID=A0ABN2BF92_9ACTN|nr:hypothetical protein [Nocardioides humi]
MTLLALVAGVLGLPGAGPPPAAALAPSTSGTIVYLKGHDIYVARPDGSGERRLTTDGTAANPWRTPSGADDGTVLAARGTTVVRMDQWGTVLNSFDPDDLWDSAGQTIGGQVVHAVVSPDGSRVAYTYAHRTCPPGGACRIRYTTAISASTQLTSAQQYGFAFYPDPSWITGSRLVTGGLTDELHVFTPGVQETIWFYDGQPNPADQHDLAEPAMSRDGSMLATVRGVGAEQHMAIWEVNGDILNGPVRAGEPGIWPTLTCAWGQAAFASPTFSPDSTSLAWAEGDGVWMVEDPLGCDDAPSLVIPGASSPHWTAAPLHSVRPIYGFAQGAKPALKAKGKVRAGKKLRATAGTWSPAPTAVRYQWLRNGKPIKKATKPVYKVKSKDRNRKISVRVTVSRTGYHDAAAVSRKVKVK